MAATKTQTQALAWPCLVGDSSRCSTGFVRQLSGQFVVGRPHGVGGAVLQHDQPAAGRLVEDQAQEVRGPAFGLTEAGHE